MGRLIPLILVLMLVPVVQLSAQTNLVNRTVTQDMRAPAEGAAATETAPAATETAPAAASANAPSAGRKSRNLSNDRQALDLLRRMESHYAQIATVRGDYRQVHDDPTFGDKIESFATFYLRKPNQFRADYKPPRESVNLITNGMIYRYTPELKQVERARFGDGNAITDLNFMLLGFGASTDELTKVYAAQWLTEGVSPGYYGIQLVPRDEEQASFRLITILITKDDNLRPVQFSMEQLNGVRTTADIDLRTLQVGGSIPESTFRPNFPRSADIVDIQ